MKNMRSSIVLLLILAIFAYTMEAKPHKCLGGKKGHNHNHNCLSHHNHNHHVVRENFGEKAILTINSFEDGGDGGGPSECDNKFHSDETLIVALSTRWYSGGKRCHHFITIHGNGRSVRAKVVDECDERHGCRNNIVDASKAVWKALGVPKRQWGELHVTWTD